nr:DUF488 family protein [Myxococcus xanthus]
MPSEPDDGFRVLVCHYRPRGLPKAKETWDAWLSNLAPSPELFDAFYGKGRTPITLDAYRERYLQEMASQQEAITALANRVRQGETVTLLCSKDCILEQVCHRTILAGLIEVEAARTH